MPPSGPMDHLSFRLGNRLLGNAEGTAGLEITLAGPRLRFRVSTAICLTGAGLPATLEGIPVPFWEPVTVPADAVLELASSTGRFAERRFADMPYQGQGHDLAVHIPARAYVADDGALLERLFHETYARNFNRTIPNLDEPRHQLLWQRLEAAKHRGVERKTDEEADLGSSRDEERVVVLVGKSQVGKSHVGKSHVGIRFGLGPPPAWIDVLGSADARRFPGTRGGASARCTRMRSAPGWFVAAPSGRRNAADADQGR